MTLTNQQARGSGGGVMLSLFSTLRVGVLAGELMHVYAREAAQHVPGATIIDPDRLHVTWAYLGNVVEEHLPNILTALETAAQSVPGPSACRVVSAGEYGNGSALGLDVDVELLPLLDAARDHLLATARPFAPFGDQGAWRPHVTIMRAPHGSKLPADLVERLSPPLGMSWIVPELRLVASLPSPGGRHHRMIHAVPLGAQIAVT